MNAGRAWGTLLVMRSPLLVVFALFACEPSIPLPDDATRLDRIVVEELRADGVPGLQAAVVREGGALVYAWGWADTRERRRVDEATIFTIASVSKLVATVAVMQQVEAGTLTLDAPLEVGVALRDPVTLRELLTHTSGIVDHWPIMEASYTPHDPVVSMRDFLTGYLEEGGAYFDPRNYGTRGRFEYSNIGIALAALAVEEVTGMDFRAYCDARIFGPLGMEDTGWFVSDVDASRLAVPTRWKPRGWRPGPHMSWPDYPNGTLRTRAEEFARFLVTVTDRSAGFLAPATVDEMLRVQAEDGQALGFFWWRLAGEDVVGHDGGEPGIATEALVRPGRGDAVVVFANGDLSPEGFRRIEGALLDGVD